MSMFDDDGFGPSPQQEYDFQKRAFKWRDIVRDLAAKPCPRTVTLLGPTCGLCGGLLNSTVNPKPDMHSTDCPWRRAKELAP